MRLLLIISISTLISAGNCLQCESCQTSDHNPTDCTGANFLCGVQQQACLAMQMTIFNNEANIISYHVTRSCWFNSSCGQSGGISSPSHKMRFSTTCCYSDGCRTPLPDLPPENNTFNGLVCPACSYFLGCDRPSYAMKCSGREEYCFSFTADKFSGCASHGYCSVKSFIGEFYRSKPVLFFPSIDCFWASGTSPLPVVSTLLCKQCRGSLDLRCERYVRCGPEHDACLTIIQTAYGGNKTTQLAKRCGVSSECDNVGSITTAQKTLSINTTCCHYDNCISPIPTVSPENKERNGYICESCYTKDHDSCSGGDRITCTGNATQCVIYTEKLIQEHYTSTEILRGCTNPRICESGNTSVTYDLRTFEETKTCSIPAKNSAHPPNILSVVFMLLPLLTIDGWQ